MSNKTVDAGDRSLVIKRQLSESRIPPTWQCAARQPCPLSDHVKISVTPMLLLEQRLFNHIPLSTWTIIP